MTARIPRRRLVDAVAEAAFSEAVRLEASSSRLFVDQPRRLGGDAAGRLVVTGGDPQVASVRELAAEVAAPFAATLPARLLAQTCKALPEGVVEISQLGSGAIQLRCGTYRVEVVPSGRVPVTPQVPPQAWRRLSGDEGRRLAWAARAGAAAMLVDPTRPAQSGVRLDGDVAVGTDGARMHVAESVDLGRAVTIPAAAAARLSEVVDAPEPAKPKKPKKGEPEPAPPPAPEVLVALGSQNLAAEVVDADGPRRVFLRLAPEPFFEWRLVADSVGGSWSRLVVGRDALLGAVRGCPAPEVELSLRPAALGLRFVVRDEAAGGRRAGAGELEVPGQLSGAPDVEVKVSTRYLRDALAGCGDEVELSASAAQPLRFRSSSPRGLIRGLIMFSR